MPPIRRSYRAREREAESFERASPDAVASNALVQTSFRERLSKYRHIKEPNEGHLLAGDACSRDASCEAISNANDPPIETIPPIKGKGSSRKGSKYAAPSKYAHLSPLVDILEPDLICVFVGTNPGVRTATAGHAYAHPSNHFWRLLHSSGLTDRRLAPEEDRSLPALYCMGNTNIVDRPSKDAAELSKDEMTTGAAVLNAKFAKYRPEAVCIVGKGIWEAIWRYKYGKSIGRTEFKYGWQDERHNMGIPDPNVENDLKPWNGSKVFVTTSTSGLAASLRPAEKEAIWKPFGEWVQLRRRQRGFIPRLRSAE